MTDREMDALVAEKVMGWTIYRDGEPLEPKYPHALIHKGKCLAATQTEIGPSYYDWCPSTSPVADYSVLVKVRDTWDYIRREQFWFALHRIWDVWRMDLPGPIHAHPSPSMYYRPGDYSRAALATLSASAGEGE